MDAKEYQEIVNTADCNAEVNYVSGAGELRILGWAKRLIEAAYHSRDSEVAEARKAGKAAWAVFQEIDELVSDIEGDWTDPRYECGKISKLIGEWFREWGIKE